MNYLAIASDSLKVGAVYSTTGFAGAVIHNYFGTRYDAPPVTGVVSNLIAGVSSVAITYFFKYELPQVSMPELTISLWSSYIGSLSATQMGFPIETEQCFIQNISGAAALGFALGVVAACSEAGVKAVERVRNAFFRAGEAHQ